MCYHVTKYLSNKLIPQQWNTVSIIMRKSNVHYVEMKHWAMFLDWANCYIHIILLLISKQQCNKLKKNSWRYVWNKLMIINVNDVET